MMATTFRRVDTTPRTTAAIMQAQIPLQQNTQSFLRRFPYEIRQLIYKALARDTNVDLKLYLECNGQIRRSIYYPRDRPIQPIHPVFLLCKQTLKEARPFFLQESTFLCQQNGLTEQAQRRLRPSDFAGIKHVAISMDAFRPVSITPHMIASDPVRDLRIWAPLLRLKTLTIADGQNWSEYFYRGWPGKGDREHRCRVAVAKLISTALHCAGELCIAIRSTKQLVAGPSQPSQEWTSPVCLVRIRGEDKRVWLEGQSEELVKEVEEDLKALPEVNMGEWRYDLIVV